MSTGTVYFELLENEGECVEFYPKIILLHDIALMYRMKIIFMEFFLRLKLIKKLI
jgi:hypothetical protein